MPSIEVDIDDVLDGMSSSETRELVEDLLEEGWVPDGWHSVQHCGWALLDDPVRLLEVIVALRSKGYTVEVANADSQ